MNTTKEYVMSEVAKKHGELKKITGLYKRTTKDGLSEYFQGKVSINGVTDFYVKVFKNKIAKSKNSPDYNLCVDIDNELKNVSGLWVTEMKKGGSYLQGRIGGFYIKVFENNLKRNENDPDYTLNLSPILDAKEIAGVSKSSFITNNE